MTGLAGGLTGNSSTGCSLEGCTSGLAGAGSIGNSSSTVSTRMGKGADGSDSSASGTMGNGIAGRCLSMALLTALCDRSRAAGRSWFESKNCSSPSLSSSPSKLNWKVESPNIWDHSGELKSGRDSKEAATVANQSSNTMLNWLLM